MLPLYTFVTSPFFAGVTVTLRLLTVRETLSSTPSLTFTETVAVPTAKLSLSVGSVIVNGFSDTAVLFFFQFTPSSDVYTSVLVLP